MVRSTDQINPTVDIDQRVASVAATSVAMVTQARDFVALDAVDQAAAREQISAQLLAEGS